jgi:hypothetical protein
MSGQPFEKTMKTDQSTYESIGSFKAYWVDTSARILWYVPILGLWEKLIVGMDNSEVFISRTAAVAWNLGIGRLHGKIREWLSALTGITIQSPRYKKFFLDTLTGLIVTSISYTASLALSGASLEEAKIALPFALIFGLATGRPYGRYLDWYRKKWHTKPVLNT